jgi:DNA glycosylase AlkZ-like
MTLDIVRYRLHNQFLSHPGFTDSSEVVKCFGAVQSQDYAGGKWALGLRMKEATNAALDNAFNEGRILRTHVLRPTWHFIAPEDIRWMLALSGPRVHAVNGFMYRQQELDRTIIKKSYAVLEKSLQGNKQLTRTELGFVFEQAGINNAQGVRLGYFMMSAELDGLICSGARKGKQFTYTLLEERVPKVRALTREEALVELTRRYFATRGPATLYDFTWWSGLTMADAREGIEALKSQFVSEVIDGKTYWFDSSVSAVKEKSPTAHLLPNYDEYFVGFRDRSAIGEIAKQAGIKSDDPSFLAHVIILDGQLVGGWRRTIQKETVQIQFMLITDLTKDQMRAVERAASQYGEFLQLPVERV